MKRVNFYYSTKLTFDDYVHNHSFALRIMPPETDTQHILSCSLNISPYVSTQQTVDAFGNNVTAGYMRDDHRFLDFEIKGSAEVDHTKHRFDLLPCYLYQSQYTKPDDGLKAFYDSIKGKCTGTASDKAEYICNILSDTIGYEKGFTDTTTTAAQAFALKKIAGLAFCDGETHSWVEYWTGDHWEGIDPANNCPVSDDYLVISQGRDFRDCAIDRGVMFGKYTKQLRDFRDCAIDRGVMFGKYTKQLQLVRSVLT